MAKKPRPGRIFHHHAAGIITACMTAGGGALGAVFVQNASNIAARGDMTAVGIVSGAVSGFLICASSLKL